MSYPRRARRDTHAPHDVRRRPERLMAKARIGVTPIRFADEGKVAGCLAGGWSA
jgi:hypothetical protein